MGFFKKMFEEEAPKRWAVQIRGTLYRSGIVIVDRTFVVDDSKTASAFLGPDREAVLLDWLRQNYTGAKCEDPRRFGVNVWEVEK